VVLSAAGQAPPSGTSRVEHLAGPFQWGLSSVVVHPLILPGGQLLLPVKVAGRDQLMVASPGKRGIPLFHGHEETTLPAVLLGSNRLAFTMYVGNRRRLRIATLQDGNAMLEPIDLGVDSADLDALTSTADGKLLYFVRFRQIYEVPSDGSRPPRKIEAGDGVAVDPRTGGLLIQRFLGDGVHLFRLAAPGSPLEEVQVESGGLRLAPVPMAARAIDQDGRVLVTVAPADTAFWQACLLLPGGKLQLLPVHFDGDVYPTGWYKDGRIVGMGYPFYGELWRFTRTTLESPLAGPR
jgi:hypothetical protein